MRPLTKEAVEMTRQGLLNSEWCGFSKRDTVNQLCDLALKGLTSASEKPSTNYRPYPAEKPKPDGDSRHLVILVNGDMHWVGIRSYDYQRDCWYGRGNCAESHEQVWYFKPLLEDGERLPPIPNAAEQVNDPTDTPELRWQRTTK